MLTIQRGGELIPVTLAGRRGDILVHVNKLILTTFKE